MPGTERFVIGAEVSCTDGACGTLSRVVVDPVARVVTHLIVAPRRGQQPDRLVPLGLVGSAAGGIRLACTVAEFDRLDPAEETRFITGRMDVPNYRQTDVVRWTSIAVSARARRRLPALVSASSWRTLT